MSMKTILNAVPAKEIDFKDLVNLIGRVVTVTVADGPKQIQNGPTMYAGTVQTVYQHSPTSRSLNASEGAVHFVGRVSARWSEHQVITIAAIDVQR